jgi:hypothetical protein
MSRRLMKAALYEKRIKSHMIESGNRSHRLNPERSVPCSINLRTCSGDHPFEVVIVKAWRSKGFEDNQAIPLKSMERRGNVAVTSGD